MAMFRLPQLAYLVGLPPNEVPAVEIARGDLVEVVPASYGVVSRAFHFWSVLADWVREFILLIYTL